MEAAKHLTEEVVRRVFSEVEERWVMVDYKQVIKLIKERDDTYNDHSIL